MSYTLNYIEKIFFQQIFLGKRGEFKWLQEEKKLLEEKREDRLSSLFIN